MNLNVAKFYLGKVKLKSMQSAAFTLNGFGASVADKLLRILAPSSSRPRFCLVRA